MKELKDYIMTIPNYPKEGIMFRDITALLNDADGLKLAIDELTKIVNSLDADVICGTESRGFVFGTPIAYNLHKPFVLIRKAGKLPRPTVSQSYDLEYGSATIEVQKDDIKPGQKVVIVDDLLATGGTLKACANVVEKLGANVVGLICLIELPALKGRETLKDYNVYTVVNFEGE